MRSGNGIWVAGSAILAVAIVVLGWFLGVSPRLTDADTARQAVEAAKAQNQIHEAELEALRTRFADIDSIRAEAADLAAAVPAVDNLAAFIRELTQQAERSSLSIDGVTTGDPVAYVPPVETSVDGAPAPDPTAAPAPINSTNFFLIPITISVSGKYSDVLQFSSELQSGTRLFFESGVAATKPVATDGADDTATGQYSATIDGLVFVLIDPAAVAAAPAP